MASHSHNLMGVSLSTFCLKCKYLLYFGLYVVTHRVNTFFHQHDAVICQQSSPQVTGKCQLVDIVCGKGTGKQLGAAVLDHQHNDTRSTVDCSI